MYFTPSDLKDRFTYIDRSLDIAFEELNDPEIQNSLGVTATRFSNILATAQPISIVAGEAQMPTADNDVGDVLPVLALKRDESVVMHSGYWSQTELQKTNTLQLFNSWKPIDTAAQR